MSLSASLRIAPAALLGGLLCLTGCSDAGQTSTLTGIAPAKANWQIGPSVSNSTTATLHAAAVSANSLGIMSGAATAQAGNVSLTLHTQAATSCVAPSQSFTLAGQENADSSLSLTGSVAGGTMTLAGTVAPDGKSLTNATYTVSGGSCATAKTAVTAQAFTAVSGTYAGNFSDTDGNVATVSATLSQSPSSDVNGNYTLSGTATVSNNPCFPTTVPVSNTQVTGGTFTFTYTYNNASITANGTFSQDATTLSVTSWSLTGSCGADTGAASTMTKQGS